MDPALSGLLSRHASPRPTYCLPISHIGNTEIMVKYITELSYLVSIWEIEAILRSCERQLITPRQCHLYFNALSLRGRFPRHAHIHKLNSVAACRVGSYLLWSVKYGSTSTNNLVRTYFRHLHNLVVLYIRRICTYLQYMCVYSIQKR